MTKRIYWLVVIAALAFLQTPLAVAAPVKVFILAGQSNMVGYGKTINGLNPSYLTDTSQPREIPGGIGSLTWAVQTMPGTFGYGGTDPLVDSNGNWLVRDDVNVYASLHKLADGTKEQIRKGPHDIGFGANNNRSTNPAVTQIWNGPDYGFGHVVGNALDDDVLIIKVATGGTSLQTQWRSPTAVANRGGAVGYMWPHMVDTVNSVLANLGTANYFPEYAGQGYEIAGFGWHQGWNDRTATGVVEYEANLRDLIADVRGEFGTNLPVVVANTGIGGVNLTGVGLDLVNAQNAVADMSNVLVVDTRPMFRDNTMSPSTVIHHWNHNGITYYEIGAGMGDAMLSLLPVPEPSSLVLAVMGLGALLRLGRRNRARVVIT